MRQINFITLKLFVAVAAERSLTKAAEREHLALAAVSKRISDLEAQLGSILLYRQAKGVELTPAGHALLYHARKMMDNLSQLTAELSEFSAGIKGHVRIHANTSSVIQFLPDDLSAFVALHPQVKIDLQEQFSSDIVRAVAEGLTDIGIFAGTQTVEGLAVFPYRCDQLVLVTSQGHPLAEASSLALADCMDYDFIGLSQDASLHRLLQQTAAEQGSHLRLRIQVRSFEAIGQMIARGMGIGVLPERAVRSYLPSLGLQSIPLTDLWAQRELYIAVRNLEMLSLPARQMLEHLLPASISLTDQPS